MNERAGVAGANEEGATELTIPYPITRMARSKVEGHERVAGGPMSNILEAWRMYRRFGRGPMRLRRSPAKKSFSTSQLRRQYVWLRMNRRRLK